MKTVIVPKPCSYAWDKMTHMPDEKGRHCAACDKVVVDFTAMSTEQIIQYLKQNKSSKVCGHFNTIDTTAPTWYQKPLLHFYNHVQSAYRKNIFQLVSLVLLSGLVALSGCKKRLTGEPAYNGPDTTKTQTTPSVLKTDTTANP